MMLICNTTTPGHPRDAAQPGEPALHQRRYFGGEGAHGGSGRWLRPAVRQQAQPDAAGVDEPRGDPQAGRRARAGAEPARGDRGGVRGDVRGRAREHAPGAGQPGELPLQHGPPHPQHLERKIRKLFLLNYNFVVRIYNMLM